eukprot:Filipodium_phascolosomae@DN1298_c0_g1_i1.p1
MVEDSLRPSLPEDISEEGKAGVKERIAKELASIEKLQALNVGDKLISEDRLSAFDDGVGNSIKTVERLYQVTSAIINKAGQAFTCRGLHAHLITWLEYAITGERQAPKCIKELLTEEEIQKFLVALKSNRNICTGNPFI